MANVLIHNNSNMNASFTQQASFCFCIPAGDTRQRPSVSLQLTDLTKSFRI
ncbi:hypothetical protein [Chamaesiphon polymorphus]|uniref:hypothetical protein n=1 Tax=Chamaesiphon polymorphus TaxID=2107691 RepID=UPI0015E78ECD|nr:hypothetical protein [Chamaesiphon polymorphus]